MLLYSHELKILNFLWLSSKCRFKGASYCAKNVFLIYIHPVFWIEERGPAFMLCSHTENQDQVSFCPFTPQEVSVLPDLALNGVHAFNPKSFPKLLP